MRSSAQRDRAVRRQRQAYLAAHPGFTPYQLPPGNAARHSRAVYLRWLASALSGRYFQQHTPVRQQTAPVGHAVRFGYLQTALALLHRAGGAAGLLPVLEQSWERLVTRRLYVTGGMGALAGLEGFGRDDELPAETAYAETCAALASIFWSWQMALVTGAARYSDLVEWQLYNAAGVGLGLGGDAYFYHNPLLCRGGVTRQPWYAVACCPSNLSRTWADLGSYIYAVDGGDLCIHQWIGSRARLPLAASTEVELTSELPWRGAATVTLRPERPAEFAVRLRGPSWAVGRMEARINGRPVPLPAAPPPAGPTASGFDPRRASWLTLRRRWAAGDRIDLAFDLDVMARRAGPRVAGHGGKIALTRGPLVYCLESHDNPGVDLFTARVAPADLRAEPAPDLLGGIMVLRGQALTAIPYALWGNRGPSQMTVWVNG
jgi:hypothetical protein